jgi:hypothetical protein
MARRSRSHGLLLTIPLIAGGCLLGPSLDGLSGSGADDAGTEGGGDARPSADVSDASAVTDGAEAAAPPVRCEPTDGSFCADFDDARVEYGWDQLDTTSGGARQDPTAFITPPFSFLAITMPDGSVPPTGTVMLKRTVAIEPIRVHASFDYRIEALDLVSGSEVMFFRLRLGATTTYRDYYTVSISHATTGLIIWQQNYVGAVGEDVGPHFRSSQTPPFNTWTHVDFDVDFGARTFTLRLDGNTTASGSLFPTATKGPLRFQLGLDSDSVPGDIRARFDHFSLRTE